MASDGTAAARPRTSGEILDDAWRLYFADPPSLLLLSGMFLTPAFAGFLYVVARPAPSGVAGRWVLAAVAAALAILTGLGSGACQEYFRRHSEGRRAGVWTCLSAALRRAPGHLTIRAAVLGVCLVGVFGFVPWLAGVNAISSSLAALLGAGYLLLPAAVVWSAAAPAHAALAGAERRSGLVAEIGRAARLDAVKSAVVTLSRVPVLALAFFNLHLLVRIGVWAATNLAGLDVALASAELSLGDPVYVVALGLLCWLLLTPYFEASNFLLYLDARTRQEGLDLLQRVRRAFPSAGRTGAVLLVAALSCLGTARARAADPWPVVVREVKAEVDAVAAEATAAEPYPGSKHWVPRLRTAGKRLQEAADTRPRRHSATWFAGALRGFGGLDRKGALRVLDDIRQRLSLLEETLPAPDAGIADGQPPRSKEEIKNLVRRRGGEDGDAATDKTDPRQREEPKRRDAERDAQSRGAQAATPVPRVEVPSGLGTLGGVLLLGLMLAVLAVAIVRFRSTLPRTPVKREVKATELPQEAAVPRPDEQSSPVLWRQAEELARAGKHREAVRVLYLAVLSFLHGHGLLRYETTRTNGEYVRQVRLAPQAPPGLAEPFAQLTREFEALWYGGRDAAAGEFQTCLSLAETARALAQT
jgi:hypothetical protein